MKKKIIKPLIICLSIYLVFAAAATLIFHSINYNAVDNVAVPYLQNNTDFENEYGDITLITRDKTIEFEEDESTIKAIYTVNTEEFEIVLRVILNKTDGGLTPDSIEIMEIMEVQKNGE